MRAVVFCGFCLLVLEVVYCSEQKMEKQLATKIVCRKDQDCSAYDKNSLCIDNTVDTPGHCECFSDYIPQQNDTHFQCLSKPQTFSDHCIKDVQCKYVFTNWAECRNGKCACSEGSHFWEKECYQTIRLGQTCSFNQQCWLKTGNITSCIAGKCTCGFQQHPVSTPSGDSCELDRELGQDCNKDEECVPENSRCFGTCKCKPGYTTNGDGRACLKEAEKLRDFCIEDTQCEKISNYTYCEQQACRCRHHHHVYLSKCYKSVRLNGTCTDDRNCWYHDGSKDRINCKEGRCTCTHKYSEDGTHCFSGGFKIGASYFAILSGVVILIWETMYSSK